MEHPKALSASVTTINDGSVPFDKELRSPQEDAKSNSDFKDGESDARQETNPEKHEGPIQDVDSEVGGEKTSRGHDDDNSFEADKADSEHKVDSISSDGIELITKKADLEANVSASFDRSGLDQEKEDQAADPNVVDWDGPEDPKNPMNWPAWKIKTHIFLVSAITFIR